MSFIEFKHIGKKYAGAEHKSVDDFNLNIEEKEFIAFVGPSGCGKSTTLRMIAGFEEITEGDLYIDGKRVNAVSYTHLLKVQHLGKSFGNNEILKDIDFSVKPKDVTCIIGPSGSGKSTLLRCMNLLETPSSGEIRYHGTNIMDKHVNVPEYLSLIHILRELHIA